MWISIVPFTAGKRRPLASLMKASLIVVRKKKERGNSE